MKIRSLALATVAASLAIAPAAHAQAAKPTPCAGYLKTDPAGDNTTFLVGNDTGIPSQANGDLLGLFFNRTASQTVMAWDVAEVNKTIPPGAISLVYRWFYTVGDTTYYLETGVTLANSTDPYFEYGTFETTFTELGQTSGFWHEGANGTIWIVIPAEAGGKPGVKFSELYGWASYGRPAVLTPTDYIPDGAEDGTRLAWNGSSCPEGATPGTPTAGSPNPTDPANPTNPGSPNPSNPNPGDPAAGSGPLRISASPSRLRASKVKKARRITFTLETRESVSDVVVTLRKGSKALGSGKLARLDGASKVALKLKRKGLKKGSYALVVAAKRADGRTGTVTLRIKVA